MERNQTDIVDQERLISNIVLLGRVVSTDYKTDLGRVCVQIGPEKEKDSMFFLPWLRRRGGLDWEWWAPEVDEQVVILSPDGDLNRAVIVGSLPYSKLKESIIPDSQRRSLEEGEKPPSDSEKKKKELSSHVMRYGDKTEISYDKKKHLYQASFTENKTVKFTVDALKDKEKISVAIKESVKTDLDATPDKESISINVKEIGVKLSAEPSKEFVDLKIKNSVLCNLSAEDGKESVEIKVKDVKAKIDASSGSEKVSVDVMGKSILELDGKGNIKITNSGGIELKFDASGNVSLKCNKLEVKSSGTVDIKGAMINLNC